MHRAEADVCDTAWMKTSNRNMEKEAEVEILLHHKLWRLLYERPWVFHTDSACACCLQVLQNFSLFSWIDSSSKPLQNAGECTHSRISFHRSFLTHRRLLYSMQYNSVLHKHGCVALSTLKLIRYAHVNGLKVNTAFYLIYICICFNWNYDIESACRKMPFFRPWYINSQHSYFFWLFYFLYLNRFYK